MSNEVPGLLAFALITFVAGFFIGGCSFNSCWEDSAKARGAMEYNKQTGILEWKPELQRKDAK